MRCVHISVLTSSARFTILGIVIALFFQCMSALLNPVRPTYKGTKWGLVVHTVAMFSLLMIGATTNRSALSTSFVDDREFPGVDTVGFPPGPLGYYFFTELTREVTSTISTLGFPFNQWLADGLLVSSALNSAAQPVSDIGRSSSCTVVMPFIRGTTGLLPSHPWCTSPLSVRT
jgi:hypothetical protein